MVRPIERATVRAELERQRKAGFRIDDRFLRELERPGGAIHLVTLSTKQDFLSLVWQSTEETRPLTPVGAPRTLRDCAERLRLYNWSFVQLCNAGYPWFDVCSAINQEFDYAKFGWVALQPMNEHEQRESPSGTYYVFDGVHRTLVLAKKLVQQEVCFQAVEAILLTPRR